MLLDGDIPHPQYNRRSRGEIDYHREDARRPGRRFICSVNEDVTDSAGSGWRSHHHRACDIAQVVGDSAEPSSLACIEHAIKLVAVRHRPERLASRKSMTKKRHPAEHTSDGFEEITAVRFVGWMTHGKRWRRWAVGMTGGLCMILLGYKVVN